MAFYRTDLFTLNVVESPSSDSTLTEFTGATAGGQGGNQGKTDETDFFIQDSQCLSKTFNATGVGGFGYEAPSAFTVPADGATYTWTYWAAPNSVANKASGGHQIHLGNATNAYRKFYVDGSDTQEYGGWKCYPVNYAQSANGTTLDEGSPTGTTQVLGYAVNNSSAISKGNPFGLDAMRYGRGTIAATASSCNFDGIAGMNDKNDGINVGTIEEINGGHHRLGIFSFQKGVYELQGRLLLGMGSNPITTEAGGLQNAQFVSFTDSNKTIIIQECTFCSANFNLIEIQNASSTVNLTNISIKSLAGEAGNPARGNFIVTDALTSQTVTLTSCNFQDMGTFQFNTNVAVNECGFTDCGIITQNNSVIDGCTITKDTLLTDEYLAISTPSTLANFKNCSFSRLGSTGHAVFIDNITADDTITWDGNTLTGSLWNGTVGDNLTGTTHGAIRLRFTSGTPTITIQAINGATVPSVRIVNDGGTGTVNVEQPVPVNVKVKDPDGNNESGVVVAILDSSGTTLTNQITDTNGELPSPITVDGNIDLLARFRKTINSTTSFIPLEVSTNSGAIGTVINVTMTEDTNYGV
jgi:hypothetical protein